MQELKLEVATASSYADRIPRLLKGEGDVIVAIFDTEDRRKLVSFSTEVMPTHNVAVTLKPAPVVADVAALKALPSVGAIKGLSPRRPRRRQGCPRPRCGSSRRAPACWRRCA